MSIILYDLSRLIARRGALTATGIDRVDLAYANWLRQSKHKHCFVVQVGPRLAHVPSGRAATLLDYLTATWGRTPLRKMDRASVEVELGSGFEQVQETVSRTLDALLRKHSPSVYVNISHHGIANNNLFSYLQTRYRTRFCFYIHDILPIQFPEYVRLGDDEEHAKRMRTVFDLEPLILTNSDATHVSLQKWARQNARSDPRVEVLHIGVEDHFVPAASAATMDNEPYFLVVGTIEPRKNHMLLLHLWRAMAGEGEQVPQLVVVGKRGWENEGIKALLDRSPSLKSCVTELSNVTDLELQTLMYGARALLFPSFGEGWGMPLVEALAMGVPVLCSDIDAFREAGQGIPDYIDPLDASAWRTVIQNYELAGSELRQAQLHRMTSFVRPSWEQHFCAFDKALLAYLSEDRIATFESKGRLLLGGLSLQEFYLEHREKIGRLAEHDLDHVKELGDSRRDSHLHLDSAIAYADVVRRDSSLHAYWVQFGHMLKESGNLTAACEAYNCAFEMIPDDVDLHVQFGHLMMRAGREEQANMYYRMAMELDPAGSALRYMGS
ncbi:glycosyltransferase [Brevundimonas diminuta]|uniref:glycosyltransferase family 4 protein n=1 Tax=Brevundimonas diminuta TaxID=293 RepID=UPI003D9A1523